MKVIEENAFKEIQLCFHLLDLALHLLVLLLQSFHFRLPHRVPNQCLSNSLCLASPNEKAVLCKLQPRLLTHLNADPDPAFHLNVSKIFITFSGPSTLFYIRRTKLTLKHILIWPTHSFGSRHPASLANPKPTPPHTILRDSYPTPSIFNTSLFFLNFQQTRFHLNADPTFHFNADPDPAPHQSDGNLLPLVFRLSTAPFRACRPPCLHSHGPLRLYFEPLKLLFDFNADPEPASKNNADLDPQPWFQQQMSQEKTKKSLCNGRILYFAI